MLDTSPRTVVLVDGSIESLTCAAIAMDRIEANNQSAKVLALSFFERSESAENHSLQQAIERQFEFLGCTPSSTELQASVGRLGLVKALDLAGPQGTILWGHRCTMIPDAIADTLALVDHLAGVARYSQPSYLVHFDLPLLDLTAGQVLDLASALGAPLGACWSCQHAGHAPCGECPSCSSWLEASKASGRPLPWVETPTVG